MKINFPAFTAFQKFFSGLNFCELTLYENFANIREFNQNLQNLRNGMPNLPVAHVTNKSSNSSFLCNLNMAPANPAKRVPNVNVENFKSSHSPAEKE